MSAEMKRFEDLKCWQEARKLVRRVYAISAEEPFSRDFGLRDQIRRAAASIMANIAEGFGTFSDQEFIRFLGYAKRSGLEVQSHSYVASDIGYINEEVFNEIFQQSDKCVRYLKSFIKYLNRKTQ